MRGEIIHILVTLREVSQRRQHEELLREKAVLASLNGAVAVALSQSADLREMLGACAEALVWNLDAAFARIWTLNRAANVLELQASAGLYTHLDGPHGRIPVGEFKIGRIAQERKPHLTNDVLQDPFVSDPEWAKREGMVSFAGFPLTVEERLVGVMALFGRQPMPETVMTALASVADAIAVGIERKRSEVLLATVLDNVTDGIIGIDGEGMIRSFNLGAERLFGYREAEVVGHNIEMLMPASHSGGQSQFRMDIALSGQDALLGTSRPAQACAKDGKTFEVELSSSEFLLDGKRHFTLVVRDITVQKQLEMRLQQSQKIEAVGLLAGGIAHDFNNALTVISGYSEFLLSELPREDPRREALEAIQDAGERAASLTRQLLSFSRRSVQQPKILDLNEVVRETERMLRRLIGEDILLTTVLDPHISRVRVDPGQLGQVLMNLAVNSRDAMPRGGKLTIETRDIHLSDEHCALRPEAKPGRYVVLAITDTGHGMTAEVQSRMFEPFFTTKGVGKGTGLGLATVHGIVRQSGGHIDVYSEVGLGTTIKAYLPAVGEAVSTTRRPDADRVGRGVETLLLVEDDEGVRRLALLALQAHGYKVLVAKDGKEAQRISREPQERIDMLVTDVVMPGMSGRELAELLRARCPNLKVLYTSGYTDDAVVRHGVLHAEVAFLQKPYTPMMLARKVREVLDGITA